MIGLHQVVNETLYDQLDKMPDEISQISMKLDEHCQRMHHPVSCSGSLPMENDGGIEPREPTFNNWKRAQDWKFGDRCTDR